MWKTALHLASRKGHKKNRRDPCTTYKSQVLALDNSRKTTLDCAVESGHQEIEDL